MNTCYIFLGPAMGSSYQASLHKGHSPMQLCNAPVQSVGSCMRPQHSPPGGNTRP